MSVYTTPAENKSFGKFYTSKLMCMKLCYAYSVIYKTYVIVIDQFPRFVHRSMNPEGKACHWGMSIYILQQRKGLVNNHIFLAYCFHLDTINMSCNWALKNCMNVCPWPQELYNSKHNNYGHNYLIYYYTLCSGLENNIHMYSTHEKIFTSIIFHLGFNNVLYS